MRHWSWTKRLCLLAGIALVLGLLFGRGGPSHASSEEIRGKVVDVDGAPLADVVVHGRWIGVRAPSLWDFYVRGWHARDVCYHIAVTTTDANGDFLLPRWSRKLEFAIADTYEVRLLYKDYVPFLDAYKFGYRRAAPRRGNKPRKGDPVTLRLVPLPPDPAVLLEQTFKHPGCADANLDPAVDAAFRRRLYEDARSVATTPEQLERIRSMQPYFEPR